MLSVFMNELEIVSLKRLIPKLERTLNENKNATNSKRNKGKIIVEFRMVLLNATEYLPNTLIFSKRNIITKEPLIIVNDVQLVLSSKSAIELKIELLRLRVYST